MPLTKNTEMAKITFKLTDEEMLERAKAASKTNIELQDEQSEFDHIKKKYKQKIDTLEEELQRLLEVIAEGKEEREVRCELEKDFSDRKMLYLYDGKIVHTRSLTNQELQMDL